MPKYHSAYFKDGLKDLLTAISTLCLSLSLSVFSSFYCTTLLQNYCRESNLKHLSASKTHWKIGEDEARVEGSKVAHTGRRAKVESRNDSGMLLQQKIYWQAICSYHVFDMNRFFYREEHKLSRKATLETNYENILCCRYYLVLCKCSLTQECFSEKFPAQVRPLSPTMQSQKQ